MTFGALFSVRIQDLRNSGFALANSPDAGIFCDALTGL
jgi:hypothetical protein